MSYDYNRPLSVNTAAVAAGDADIPPRRQMYSSPENTSGSLQSPSTPNTVIFQPTLITAATPGGPQVAPIHVQTQQSQPESPKRRSADVGGPRSPRQSQLEEPGSPKSPKLMRSPLSPSSKQMPENLRLSINEAVVDKAVKRQSLEGEPKPKGPMSPPPSLTPEPEEFLSDQTDSPALMKPPQARAKTAVPPPETKYNQPASVRAEPVNVNINERKQKPEALIVKAVPAKVEPVAEAQPPQKQESPSVRPAKLKIPPPTLPKPKNRPKSNRSSISNRSSVSSEINHYDVPRIHPMSLQGTPMSETASTPSTPMSRQQYSNARGSISSRGSTPAQSPTRAPWERPATKVAPWDRHPGLPPKSGSVKVQSPYGAAKPPMQKAMSFGGQYAVPQYRQGSAENSPRGSASGDIVAPLNQSQSQPKKVATVKPNSSTKQNSYSSFAEHLEGQPITGGSVKVTPPTIKSDKSIKIATYIEEDNS